MSQKKIDDNILAKGFLFGAATSAQQVEGGVDNNWTNWERNVADKLASGAESRLSKEVPKWKTIATEAQSRTNYISGTAADHYERYIEDFDIMQKLGFNSYRFSIEWSRIEPELKKYNHQAIDHYAKMISALIERGIEPLVTLHHFTDPKWLEDHGGWHGDEAVDAFKDYCAVVAKAFGSKVNRYVTFNEPGSYLLMRYLGGGAWPEWPKTVLNPAQGYRFLGNLVSSQRLVRNVIKEINPSAQVGLAHGLIDYQLGRHDPLSWLVKKQLDYWPDVYLINRLKRDIDFIGVNYYLRMIVKFNLTSPINWAKKWNGTDPRNDMGWGVYPEGLYNVTQKIKKYHLPLLITENGIPDMSDKLRGNFIKAHLDQVVRSIQDGADINGYFYWSLLDNYEWSEGYWPKFGLVEVDRKTQKRTLKPSAQEYMSIIRAHKR